MGVSERSETSCCDSDLKTRGHICNQGREVVASAVRTRTHPAVLWVVWSEREISQNGWIMQLLGQKLPGRMRKCGYLCRS